LTERIYLHFRTLMYFHNLNFDLWLNNFHPVNILKEFEFQKQEEDLKNKIFNTYLVSECFEKHKNLVSNNIFGTGLKSKTHFKSTI